MDTGAQFPDQHIEGCLQRRGFALPLTTGSAVFCGVSATVPATNATATATVTGTAQARAAPTATAIGAGCIRRRPGASNRRNAAVRRGVAGHSRKGCRQRQCTRGHDDSRRSTRALRVSAPQSNPVSACQSRHDLQATCDRAAQDCDLGQPAPPGTVAPDVQQDLHGRCERTDQRDAVQAAERLECLQSGPVPPRDCWRARCRPHRHARCSARPAGRPPRPPRTSPTTMRSGRIRNACRTKSRTVTSPTPSTLAARATSLTRCGCGGANSAASSTQTMRSWPGTAPSAQANRVVLPQPVPPEMRNASRRFDDARAQGRRPAEGIAPDLARGFEILGGGPQHLAATDRSPPQRSAAVPRADAR